MICPKCQNVMKTVDKSGIHLEQCEGCRGIFLDRGELEQIVSAENAYYGQPAAAAAPPPYRPGAAPPPPPPPPPGGHAMPGGHAAPGAHGGHYGYADSPRPHRGGGYYKDSPRPYGGGYKDSPRPYGGHGHGRRKRGFLEGLFD